MIAASVQAESPPASMASLSSGTRKISIKVQNGHLMAKQKDPSYTQAMSDGMPAPKIIIDSNQQIYLGYNDSESNARVARLDSKFQIQKEIIYIKGKRLEDFVADDRGIALLLTEFDIEKKQNYNKYKFHTAHIEKYNRDGRVIFRTRIVGTHSYNKTGDQGIDTVFGNFNIAYNSKDNFATYFSTYRRWDDGITHQSEYLALFDSKSGKRLMQDTNRKKAKGFTWNVSHSFRPRFVYDGERYIMATVGDAYPRGLVVQSYPHALRTIPIQVPEAKTGETYQYVPVSTGDLYARNKQTWIVFDSSLKRNEYDIGLVRVNGKEVSRPVYLTRTGRVRERIPRITPFGKNHFLILWMKDYGPAKKKWHPTINTMATEGAIINAKGQVVSRPAAFGKPGQFTLRADTRLFHFPDGRSGWVNDATGLADQLEIILLPGPGGKTTDVDNPEIQPEKEIESIENETIKINPELNTPLLQAIYDGQNSRAIELLKKGASPDARKAKWTALMYAAYFGRTAVVKELIRRKANPDASVDGWTALRLAESRGHQAIVHSLKSITRFRTRTFTREPAPASPARSNIQSRSAKMRVMEYKPGKANLPALGPPKK